MKQLLEKENVKNGRVYISKFALIYSFKKNGERYKTYRVYGFRKREVTGRCSCSLAEEQSYTEV